MGDWIWYVQYKRSCHDADSECWYEWCEWLVDLHIRHGESRILGIVHIRNR